MDAILLEPVNYYKRQKGKNIRKLLNDLFGKILCISTSDMNLINGISNDFHNASLVIDDIEDNGTLRRNQPCAHLKYGIPHSLNAGYFSIFKTLQNINQNFSPQTTTKIIDYLTKIHEGQGLDIYYTQNKVIPTLKEYENMMVYKTGYVFLLQFELMMEKNSNVSVKTKHEQIKHILVLFSLFFQIRDDYINLTDIGYWREKGFCQDFDEEKISYLITYFHCEDKRDVIEMMKDKTKEGKLKIIHLFNDSGLFDKIYHKLLHLKQAILSEMNVGFIFELLSFHRFDINDVDIYHLQTINAS
jgi:geranylgeranyl pyrophosphate synthase